MYNLQLKKQTCTTTAVNWKQETINISMISATGFVLNCQALGAALFLITLKEIDYKIQDQQVIG